MKWLGVFAIGVVAIGAAALLLRLPPKASRHSTAERIASRGEDSPKKASAEDRPGERPVPEERPRRSEPRLTPALLEALARTSDPETRRTIVGALGRRPEEPAWRALVDLILTESRDDVASAAADALQHQLDNPRRGEIIDLLERLLPSIRSPNVARSVHQALQHLRHELDWRDLCGGRK
jgi:hypothetical protein